MYLLLIILCSSELFGQTGNSQNRVLAQNDSLEIQIIKIGDTTKTDYFLVFSMKDSILFHTAEYGFHDIASGFDGITIDKPHQLDNIGREEICLYHVYNNSVNLGGHNKTKYIINLDTREVMFEGKYYFNNIMDERKTYTYKISFDKDENLIINYDLRESNMQPDLKEGIYTLISSKYVWIQSQYKYTRKVIAQDVRSHVEVARISNCERHFNRYYIVNNTDSISFLFTDRCLEQDPFEYKESAGLDFRQLNRVGGNELILEWEYSGSHTYTGFHREIIIVDLDSMLIIFRMEIEARGQHFYGEQLGAHFGFKYEIDYTDEGDIIIGKPTDTPGYYTQERYTLVRNIYIKQ